MGCSALHVCARSDSCIRSGLAFLHHRSVSWTGPFDVGWDNRFTRLTFLLAVLVPGIIVGLRSLFLLREGVRLQRWPGEAGEDFGGR